MSYTTSDFITNVKTRAATPTSQNIFTDAKIMAAGDSEIRSYVLPMLLKTDEGYYDVDTSYTIASYPTGIYEIPTRAVGGRITNACLLDGGTGRLDLSWITEESLEQTNQSYYGIPGVYIKRSQLYLLPPDGAGYTTLKLTYPIRPSVLVATTAAAQITAIASGVLSFTSVPSTFTTSVTYDFIQANPHFDHVEIDKTATSITSTSMTFASVSDRLAVGDWVAIKEQTPIVQVEPEVWPLLEQATASYLFRAQGDMESLKASDAHLAKMEERTLGLYTPRIAREGKKIVNRSRIIRRS